MFYKNVHLLNLAGIAPKAVPNRASNTTNCTFILHNAPVTPCFLVFTYKLDLLSVKLWVAAKNL